MTHDEGTPAASSEHRPGFIAELEGLRGVAVLAVVLFHAHVFGVAGGFVGVDVFFVLSGFLITGILLRELEARGSISLSRFYARRARRILPAALVGIVLTVIAAALLISPLDLVDIAADGAASALSIGNIRFAAHAVDYFAQDQAPSPLLHYWSLGVEEQFYLVWPGLLLAMALVGRRVAIVAARPRLAAGFLLVGITAVSFGLAVVVASIAQPLAFYLLPSRAWELGLGGLLAVAEPSLRGNARGWRTVAGWVGLALIVAGAFLLDPVMPFPWVIVAPTVGSALVILAAIGPSAAPAVLRAPPLRFLGLISYSLYIVHWPVLTLAAALWADAAARAGTLDPEISPLAALPLWLSLALVALCIALAWVSQRFVEWPFQHGFTVGAFSLSKVRARWILAPAVAAMAAVWAGTVATSIVVERDLDGGVAAATEAPMPTFLPATFAPTAPAASPSLSSLPPASGEPTSAPSIGPTPIPTWPPVIAATGALPADVQPRLSEARADWDALRTNGCGLNNSQTRIVDCVFGDPDGDRTMVLVGDSHAQMWFPALNAIAKHHHWRLVPLTKLSCRFLDMPMWSLILEKPYTECETWKADVLERLKAMKPDLTVVVVAHDLTPINPGDDSPVRQGEALARYLGRFGGAKAVIVDTPEVQFDVPACLADNRSDVTRCATLWKVAAGPKHALLEETATAISGATLVDMNDRTCTPEVCPAVIGTFITYTDRQHLTATFVRSLAPVLESRLRPLLELP